MPIKVKNYPNQDTLLSLFTYADGRLYKKSTGKISGHNSHTYGYWRTYVNGKMFYLHRLIWIYHNGDILEGMEIDHDDLDKNNNRIENLKLVTHGINIKKQKLSKNNTSGHHGVYWVKKNCNWAVKINHNSVKMTVGTFGTLCKAIEARVNAEKQFGYHELHGKYV